MTELLRAKYHNHWYREDPSRGSGYRAISNEYSLDPILDKAAKAVSHSLPKNLARMVLTSDDRWLVMFVNPGEVTVRDKKFHEVAIYNKKEDIFNPKLSGNINAKNKYKKAVQSHSYSKSDDETFGSLDESKDENVSTKSDGEQNKKEKQKQNEKKSKTEKEEKEHKEIDVEDVREIFLRNIHNAARRNKEKE